MNKEEARLAVISEYDRWAKKHPNEASVMGGFLFFRYLQNERSDLLDFRAGDKWQIVHGWIRGRLEVLISLRSAGRQQTSESGKGK
jgi:hypothetical protein